MEKKENIIILEDNNTAIFKLYTKDGKYTGNYLEFDLEDVNLPIRLAECQKKHEENLIYVNTELKRLENETDKIEDKDNKILSSIEEKAFKIISEFYKRDAEAVDLFLGEGAVKKILNGRAPYFEMFDDIKKIIEKIMPILEENSKLIIANIKEKYKNNDDGIEFLQ